MRPHSVLAFASAVLRRALASAGWQQTIGTVTRLDFATRRQAFVAFS